MMSYEKIEQLKSLVSETKRQDRLIFAGILLIPLIIGIFIAKSAKKKKKELITLKQNIISNIEKEHEVRTKEFNDNYNPTDAFITYHEKIELVKKCNSYLDDLQVLDKNKTLFDNDFNSSIKESIQTIALIKTKIVGDIKAETKIRIDDLKNTNTFDKYITYPDRIELVKKIYSYLSDLQVFEKNITHFNDDFNVFINKSIQVIASLNDKIIDNIEKETKIRINELIIGNSGSVDGTYIAKRVELVKKCNSYLEDLQVLEKNEIHFNYDFNNFIDSSIQAIASIRGKILSDIEKWVKDQSKKLMVVPEKCITHYEKVKFIKKCNSYLDNLQILKKNEIIHNEEFNDFIEESFQNIASIKGKILDNIEAETKIRIEELINDRYSITHTYFTYHKRVKFVEKCNSYLKDLKLFEEEKIVLSDEFCSFIDESIQKITSIKDVFENYNNSDFIEKRISRYDYLFKKSSFPLDQSQKVAVVTDDTHNLVVAGAGSGKTEVLITRIAYLIERKPDTIDTERILVLAFQNKAAREVHDRLDSRFGFDTKIKTFHSLGREILMESYRDSGMDAPRIADETEQQQFVLTIFNEKTKDNMFQNEIVNYMKAYGDSEIRKSKSDFDEKEQYYEYMRNLTYTALDGTKVKSEAEREILNFFVTHDLNGKRVKVLYERPAEWMEYKKENGDTHIPKPDFFFPDYNIYLEHWAIDEYGNVPEWFEGKNPAKDYKEGMEQKKKKFAEQEKYLLVETSNKDYIQINFIEILKDRLLKALNEKNPGKNFEFTHIAYDKLVNRVWEECVVSVRYLPHHIGNFITIAKTYNLTPAEIEQRIKNEFWSPKQIEFANIALNVYSSYENRLRAENKIDFSDMINLAVKNLKQNGSLYKNRFDHILVDEYQDISQQRYELIKSLIEKNDGCKLFCVGDDWQSIMAFSGSNLDFFVHFDQYFDHPAVTYLTVNYRSCKSIVDTGAEIIKHNGDAQLKKDAIAQNNSIKPIRVYISIHNSHFVNDYYTQIAQHCVITINGYLQKGYQEEDIMILSRIANSPIMKKKLQEYSKTYDVPISFENRLNKKIRFMSVHASKGLQARVVFLLNVVDGLYGFPCRKENPDIFEPATRGRKKDREEEERRLFYVAVTRSKEDLIIYSQIDSQSKFLGEIESHVIENLLN